MEGPLGHLNFYFRISTLLDFNAIIESHESNSSSLSTISIEEFGVMVTFCNLAKIDTQEAYYSYFNGGLCSIRFLFDHGLCFESFLEYWSTISYYTLHRYHSNHHLLLLSTSTARFMEPRPFQFHGMWI